MDRSALIEAIRTSSAVIGGGSPEEIRVKLTRFGNGIRQVSDGITVDCTLAEWVAYRDAQGQLPWPQGLKIYCPYEVGAVLRGGLRNDSAVESITYFFFDVDGGGHTPEVLIDALRSIGVAYLITDSSTHGVNGAVKWHCYLPLHTPVPVAGDHKAFKSQRWMPEYNHTRTVLQALAGLTESDPSTDDLSQPIFVARMPHGGEPRRVFSAGGRLISWDDFLRVTGYAGVKGDAQPKEGAQSTPKPEGSHYGQMGDWSTVGHTSGSLVETVLNWRRVTGDRHQTQISPGKWMVLCPWRDDHSPGCPQRDRNEFDSSTTYWLGDGTEGNPGGFDCKHGHCVARLREAQARNPDRELTFSGLLLRWARELGCPWLPNRPQYQQPWECVDSTPEKEEPPKAATSEGPKSGTGSNSTHKVADDEPKVKAGSAFTAADPVSMPRNANGAVEIVIDHDTERMKDEAMVALATMPNVYVRANTLTDMVMASGIDRHGQPKRPWVRKTGKSWLKSRMNSDVTWIKVRHAKDGEEIKVRERADAETVSAILAAGAWPGTPTLEGIIYTPIVRRDGSILQTPGYDPGMGLYYHQEVSHGVINEAPTAEHVKAARDYLLDVIGDFPFESRSIAQSVWLAAVLTRFCRYSYSGLAPMFAVSARESGSGKTLLADCAAIIADGRPADMLPYTGDEEESKREILSLLGRDETHSICLDNIKVPLSSAAFEAMLTGSSTVGREVGSSEVKRIVMSDAVWWATGNYLEIGTDMSRRVLLINVYDRSGKPADRSRKHADLRGYCRTNRAVLVRAALTVLAGFAAAGGPQAIEDCDGVKVGEFASFENWASVVRQSVIWSGLPDPCRALAVTDADSATETKRAGHIVEHWRASFGTDPIQTTEASRRLKGDPKKYAALINYLADHRCTDPNPISLGKFLGKSVKGVHTAEDGSKWLLSKKETSKGVFWCVRSEA